MKLRKSLFMALISSAAMFVSYAYAATPTQPKLGIQLWSIKDDVSKDFEGTLKQLKAYGFQGVEFAGVFGKYSDDAKGLKTFLDNVGLQATSAHVPFEKLSAENFDKTVAFYKTLGCHLLIIPMDKRAATAEGAKAVAKDLSDLEAKLAPLGMHTGYHNHKAEMLDTGDTTPWDIIAKNTAASVVLEQDVGWTEAANKNPVDILKHYPGRTIVTHYKAAAPGDEKKENPIIGKDTTDWKSLIIANRTIGGTLWLIVEQEVYPNGMTPMQSVEASLTGLKNEIARVDESKDKKK